MPPSETDSFPRVTARDLLMVLQVFERAPETTLENVRLRICVDRKKQRRGTALWSAARDTVGELVKLGLLKGSCYAKNTQQYESMKANKLNVTDEGKELLEEFRSNRAAAYDAVFGLMVRRHAYLRQFIGVVSEQNLFAPVISSMRDHVSEKYTANTALVADVAEAQFDCTDLLKSLERRSNRELSRREREVITEQVDQLVRDARASAINDDTTRFAKSFLNKLNDLVIPILFAEVGLEFDFRTLRTLWSIGQEFRVWSITRSHPDYDGWLVYRTSTILLTESGNELATLTFDYGLENTRKDFLKKLFDAYQTLKTKKDSTFVSAWELRSVFCVTNSCQPGVFNRLFDESSAGSEGFKLHLEIQRQKPQHEEPLRVGKRNIGSIRVAKR